MKRILKTKTNTDVNIGLKLVKGDDRTWVDDNKFVVLEKRFVEIQKDNKNPVRVEFELKIRLRKISDGAMHLKEPWVHMQTIYGGMEGVKAYIQHKVIDSVYMWEDSDYEIVSVGLSRLYVSKAKTTGGDTFSGYQDVRNTIRL